MLLGEVLEGTGHVGLRQEKLPASGALPTTLVLGKPEKAREHIYIIHTISILSILTIAYFKQLSSFSLPSVVLAVDVSMQCSFRRCLRAVSKSADIMGELKHG